MKKLLVLPVLLLATCAHANEFWLDVVAVPPIPSDGYIRHVQVVHTTVAELVDAEGIQQTYALTQHAVRLSPKEVRALSSGLLAWADGAEPANHTVWKQVQQDSAGTDKSLFTLEVTWGHDQHGRYVIVGSFGLAWLATGHYFPGSNDAQASHKAQMRLNEDEGRELAQQLTAWSAGWNPEDANIWSKLLMDGN